MTTADRVFERFKSADTDEGIIQALTVEMEDEVDFVLHPEEGVVVVVFLDSSVIKVLEGEEGLTLQTGVYIPPERPRAH